MTKQPGPAATKSVLSRESIRLSDFRCSVNLTLCLSCDDMNDFENEQKEYVNIFKY